MSLKKYWPTMEERASFERDGFLVVPDALTADQVKRLNAAVDRCGYGEGGFFNRLDILGMDDAFLELIDVAPVFAKICGFLGWNIWVNHTHYNLRPADRSDSDYPYHWHQDGGNVNLDLQGQAPMTAIKVGFYLTDLSQPGCGQTYIIPRWYAGEQELPRALDPKMPPPEEAICLKVAPGTAVLFQQRTTHSQGSPNSSELDRKAIFMQWAFRWLFPVDTMTLADLEHRVEDPIRRQLLGFNEIRPEGRLSPYYYPHPADVPLKKKLIQEVGLKKLCEIGKETTRYLFGYMNFKS